MIIRMRRCGRGSGGLRDLEIDGDCRRIMVLTHTRHTDA